MKNILLTISLLLTLPLFAQQRGAIPVSNHQSPTTGTTRAVVIGISDYQDPAIPDLRFAHRDAEAFANFLRSPAGGSLDGDHLKLLINEQATGAQFATALDWLVEVAREGENVIIYFSGHGDVESKRISKSGYLLGWDAPSRVYLAGGAVNVRDLQDIVSTLSVQNKAKVVIITDACHAGKLSGNDINGAQLTGQNLATQFANEVKILSCQPNEYSIEGEQWGGGHGAFSYHLIDGLLGLADGDSDDRVTLLEIGRYLEDHVTAEVAPQSQIPMVVGSKTERLSTVVPEILANLQKFKSGQLAVFSPTEGKSLEDEVLARVDSTIRETYQAFKLAVREKRFLSPAGNCAEDFYTQLVQVEGLAPLRGMMKRNYAAALQDDAQQLLNKWLKTDENQTLLTNLESNKDRLPKKIFTEKVRAFPRNLDRAAELLGSGHYMYAALKARKLFFELTFLQILTETPTKNWAHGH